MKRFTKSSVKQSSRRTQPVVPGTIRENAYREFFHGDRGGVTIAKKPGHHFVQRTVTSCRQLDEERALELLKTAEFGTLSMIDENGLPYGIPVNDVWNGKDSLYIHCASEGKKLRAIATHPQVSFSIVGRVHLLPSKFTTEYESIVLKGTARVGLSPEARMG